MPLAAAAIAAAALEVTYGWLVGEDKTYGFLINFLLQYYEKFLWFVNA